MKKAHRRADRIIEYAADVSLIASFHYKKKNFHLVKLLEVRKMPLFFVFCLRHRLNLNRITVGNNEQ